VKSLLYISLAAAGFLGACGDDGASSKADARPQPAVDAAPADATVVDPVARGAYLVGHVSICGECHTPRDQTGAPVVAELLAGAECFVDIDPTDPEVGCLNTPNLTNDPTGLMNRSDAEIRTMFQDGVHPNGEFLIPVMPYWVFHNMSDDDANAIVAYLRTVPGVDKQIQPSQTPWERPDAARPALDLTAVPTPATTNPDFESATRGRYLATQAGLCLECHTPETDCGNPFGCPLDLTRSFQGGKPFAGLPMPPFSTQVAVSANITPHDPTGIGAYSVAELEAAIKLGMQRDNTIICPPMPAGEMQAFGGLEAQDLTDIINYLRGNPGVETEETPQCDLLPPPPP
jgi:mono/diheme cytochrome c family protein